MPQFPTEIILLAVSLISLWTIGVVLYQVAKRQNRLVLRLDELEDRIAHGYTAIQCGPAGLAVRTQIPSFELPDIDENVLTLDEFRGKQVLLINWNPQCGFCHLIAWDLAQLEPELEKRDVRILFLTDGDAESNREMAEKYGLTSPMLLANGTDTVFDIFGQLGTPVAYLLDELGRVAQPIAIGAEAVPAVARKAVRGRSRKHVRELPGQRPLSENRIERNGLKANAHQR